MRFPGRIRATVFMKVLLVFILIVSFVYMVFIQIIAQSKADINRQNISLIKSQVEYAFQRFETEMAHVADSQNFLANDFKLYRLAGNDRDISGYDRISALNELKEEIARIGYSSVFLSDVTLYMPTIGKRVSFRLTEDIDMPSFMEFVRDIGSSGSTVESINGNVYLNIMSPFQHFYESGVRIPYILISSLISKEGIKSHFDAFFDNGHMSYALFFIKSSEIITGSIENEELFQSYISRLSREFFTTLSGAGLDEKDGEVFYFIKSPSLGIGFLLRVSGGFFYNPVRKYTYMFVFVTLMLAAVILSFFIIARNIVNKPISRITAAFKDVEMGNVDLKLEYKRNDEFKFLYKGFNQMITRIHELIGQVYEQKIRTQEAELKQLQYQVNPHFLYNSLFILYEMIKFGDEENSMKMVWNLSNYYRYIIKTRGETIPLENEIQHARSYIEIQNARFADRITVEICEIPEGLKTFEVPRLIIQPVIENSYKHGLKNTEDKGIIEVSIYDDSGFIRIITEDNGAGLEQEALDEITGWLDGKGSLQNGTGLYNIHKRLQIKYGNLSGVFVSRGKYGGMSVELRIQRKEGIADV